MILVILQCLIFILQKYRQYFLVKSLAIVFGLKGKLVSYIVMNDPKSVKFIQFFSYLTHLQFHYCQLLTDLTILPLYFVQFEIVFITLQEAIIPFLFIIYFSIITLPFYKDRLMPFLNLITKLHKIIALLFVVQPF